MNFLHLTCLKMTEIFLVQSFPDYKKFLFFVFTNKKIKGIFTVTLYLALRCNSPKHYFFMPKDIDCAFSVGRKQTKGHCNVMKYMENFETTEEYYVAKGKDLVNELGI